MKYWIIVVLLLAGCSSSSPTAPSPPPVVTTPPVVSAPPVVIQPPPAVLPAFPPNDPRFDLGFYQQLAHNAFDGPVQPLRRFSQAPRVYLRTADTAGLAISPVLLDRAAAALINTAGALTGQFGLAELVRGRESRAGHAGWITIEWLAQHEPTVCGRMRGGVGIEGNVIELHYTNPSCACGGMLRAGVIRHELGHALGFWHTDSRDDLMFINGDGFCDKQPSTREVYHFALAYQRPIGSMAP